MKISKGVCPDCREWAVKRVSAKRGGIMPRLGWSIGLPGPFYLSSGGRRRRVWHGTLPGWRCWHRHNSPSAATACARRKARQQIAARRGIPQPQRSRFRNPLYWITGLAILEAELNACWWVLYAALNGAAWLVRRWWYIPEPVANGIAVCRPVWPSRETVQRRIAQANGAQQ